MIWEFKGPMGTFSTTDESEAHELIAALDDADFDTFDPASNGADQVYRSPEEEEKDRCYTAWGYR